MTDLTDLQAAQTIKIVGSDSTGTETNAVNSSANGELKTTDILDNSGVNGAISVGTSAVEAKVGVSILANRKELIIFHNGTGRLYYGLSNAVTTANGIEIFKKSIWSDKVGPNTHIWLISDTAGQDIRIVEKA